MRLKTPIRSAESGFTLVELMIVMLIIGVLAAVAIPSFIASIRNAKEAALKEDLHVLRDAIDSYTMDKNKAPQSLDDLVQNGYLKVDPRRPVHPQPRHLGDRQRRYLRRPRPDRAGHQRRAQRLGRSRARTGSRTQTW